MDFTGDYHMHSKYSDGRATIKDMVDSARVKGLQTIAITDHGPHNVGTGVKNSDTFLKIKKELQSLNDEYSDIQLLCGCEANIIGLDGEIDLPEHIYRELDLLIVGLHPFARPERLSDIWELNGRNQAAKLSKAQRHKVINTNTKTLIEAAYKHPVDIISHPGLGMPIDHTEVARACVNNSVLYEINCGHHYPDIEQIRAAAKQGVDFIVNSDAHFTQSVGKLTYGSKILEQANISLERVVNAAAEGKQYSWKN